MQLVHTVQEGDPDAEVGATPPNIDLTGTDLLVSERRQLLDLLASFGTLFSRVGGPLGRTGRVKHDIETSGPPIRQPLRRLPHSMKPVVEDEVQRMLQQGVIRPSTSPWSSPVVMVRKKDGSWRFCIDYRKVNSIGRDRKQHHPAINSPRTKEMFSPGWYPVSQVHREWYHTLYTNRGTSEPERSCTEAPP